MRPFLSALLLATLTVLGGDVSRAAADGLPVPMDRTGVTTTVAPSGNGPRYATVSAGRRTQLLQIEQNGGEVTGNRTIKGDFTIPLVALDGTSSGLSADGSTLALIVPRTNFRRFPRAETTFRIVDVRDGRLRPGKPLTLRGDFSFDALSPDGRTLYLVQYRSSDYNDYTVREYDIARRRLLNDPVRFSHDVAPGQMRGLPMARATSSDGRWAYTLYNGGGRKRDIAFLHILDTVEGVSHCIEFPGIHGHAAWNLDLQLTAGDGTLSLERGNRVLATMDTQTLAVAAPPSRRPSAAPKEPGDGRRTGLAIGVIGAGAVLLAGTAFAVRRRRSRRLPPDPFEPGAADLATAEALERERVPT